MITNAGLALLDLIIEIFLRFVTIKYVHFVARSLVLLHRYPHRTVG